MLKDKMVTKKSIAGTALRAVDVKCMSLIHNQSGQTSTSIVAGSIYSSDLANGDISKDVDVLKAKLPEHAVAVEATNISSEFINTGKIALSEGAAKIFNSNEFISTDSTGRIY